MCKFYNPNLKLSKKCFFPCANIRKNDEKNKYFLHFSQKSIVFFIKNIYLQSINYYFREIQLHFSGFYDSKSNL